MFSQYAMISRFTPSRPSMARVSGTPVFSWPQACHSPSSPRAVETALPKSWVSAAKTNASGRNARAFFCAAACSTSMLCVYASPSG